MVEWLKYLYGKLGLGITLMICGFGPILLVLFLAIFLHNFVGGVLAILFMIGIAGVVVWIIRP